MGRDRVRENYGTGQAAQVLLDADIDGMVPEDVVADAFPPPGPPLGGVPVEDAVRPTMVGATPDNANQRTATMRSTILRIEQPLPSCCDIFTMLPFARAGVPNVRGIAASGLAGGAQKRAAHAPAPSSPHFR